MRADLLALTPDALAALTNRGLVKRATREVEAAPPAVTADAEGTVRGVYQDGPETALPPGGLDRGTCTCGATGVCRHVVGLVLAYQTASATTGLAGTGAAQTGVATVGGAGGDGAATGVAGDAGPGVARSGGAQRAGNAGPGVAQSGGAQRAGNAGTGATQTAAGGAGPGGVQAAGGAGPGGGQTADDTNTGVARSGDAQAAGPEPAVPLEAWSPGTFTDEQLEARIGTRRLAAARRAHRAGYVARIHRPTAADPAPRVELGSATVRFLVPRDLGFVHTDAVAGVRDDVLALAVWAFRVADVTAPDGQDVQVDVGGPETAGGAVDGSLEAALRLADEVLLTGAAHVGPGLAGTVAEVRQRLDRAGLRWPLLAVGDLEEQLAAYGQRAGSYSHERLAGLVAELHARHRAVTNRGASLRARVLGTQEAAETPMRRARLDGLGCRVRAAGDTGRQVELYFAHAGSATVLVLRRTFPDAAAGAGTSAGIGGRRLGGATVAQLAAGNVVTESAIRSASRTVRLATSRVAKTTVTPSQGLWTSLPESLVVRDLRVLAAQLDRLPPRVVRPRVEAELVRVLQVAEVRSLRYAPGAQRLDALVADPAGGVATVTATHSAAAPGALDAIAAALSGTVRAVAGTVSRASGEILIEPLALAVGDGDVVVPDLAPASGFRVDGAPVPGADPLRLAVDAAVALLAEVPHRGLRMLPPTFGDRLRDAGDALTRVGLHRCAAAVGALRAGLGPDPDTATAGLWVDAYVRLLVTLELQ
ncbi:hypothetical protein AB0H83_30035 [Dactylosporangium sp. NPDC050688]|uniref:hypothetical protein n=1 Tax=Dactylosporangium sp. NPDC050688 TaxID=3157217 RepID=UPI0033C9BEBF